MFQARLNNRKARMSTQEAYYGFLLHISQFSALTQTAYKGVLKRFMAIMPEEITQINGEHIERFLLTERKIRRASSCNTSLMIIKSFFSWLEITHNVPNVARPIKKLKALPPHQRVLSREEYEQLVKTTTGDIKAIVSVLCNTGLRKGEFLSLKPENINGEFLTVFSTKTNKIRSIPLNRTAKEILANPNFFNIPKSYKRYQLNYLCIKAAKTAGIPKFSPHSCRHYFATQLSLTIPLIKISKLLGHSSIKTTEQIYIHLTDNDLLGSTDCLVC